MSSGDEEEESLGFLSEDDQDISSTFYDDDDDDESPPDSPPKPKSRPLLAANALVPSPDRVYPLEAHPPGRTLVVKHAVQAKSIPAASNEPTDGSAKPTDRQRGGGGGSQRNSKLLRSLSTDLLSTVCEFLDANDLLNRLEPCCRGLRTLLGPSASHRSVIFWSNRFAAALERMIFSPMRSRIIQAVSSTGSPCAGLPCSSLVAAEVASHDDSALLRCATFYVHARRGQNFANLSKSQFRLRVIGNEEDQELVPAPSDILEAGFEKYRTAYFGSFQLAINAGNPAVANPALDSMMLPILKHVVEASDSAPASEEGAAAGQPATRHVDPSVDWAAQMESRRPPATAVLRPLFDKSALTLYGFLLSSAMVLDFNRYAWENEDKTAIISRLIGPSAKTVELRFFYSFRDGSFPRMFSKLVYCTSVLPVDCMEAKFNESPTDQKEVFCTGFGRVEVDVRPRVSRTALNDIAHQLDLGAFPMELLWNVIVHASGMTCKLWPHTESLRAYYSETIHGAFEKAMKLV